MSPDRVSVHLRVLRAASRLALGLGAVLVAASSATAQQQTGSITGRVVHAQSGEPLPNATIQLVNTMLGTRTDESGNFTLGAVPAGTHQVQARHIGYRSVTEGAQVVAGQRVTLAFSLFAAPITLDQVIVTGQGTGTAQREIGASIVTIDAAATMETENIQSVSQLLQSRAPGVTVLSGGGKAGQGSKIILRGVGSLSQDIQPLFYIDGVRMETGIASGVGTGGAEVSPIDDINPDDIERIEIIKGAAAATMYGTEASGGVIQIFTKQGRGGPQRWSARQEYGQSAVPFSYWDVSVFAPYMANEVARQGSYRNSRLSVDGSVDNFTYSLSGNLRSTGGVLPMSAEDYSSFRSNLGFSPRSNFRLNVNTSYARRYTTHPQDGNNTYSWTANALGGGARGSFTGLGNFEDFDVSQTSGRFNAMVRAEYSPWSNLSSRLTVGADILNTDDLSRREFGSIYSSLGYRYSYRRKVHTLNVDNAQTLRMQLTPRVGSTTSFGFQAYSREDGRNRVTGGNFPGPGFTGSVGAAGSTSAWEWRQWTKSAGFFGEQQFAWDNLLYVTVGARLDGHSAFGEAFGYQFYPKIDASYVLHEHGFLPEQIGQFRIRAAYGTAGQQPGAFDSRQTWTPVRALEAVPAVSTQNIGNPNLAPEVSHEFEYGLDADFLQSRVGLEITRYEQQTKGALFNVRYPYSTGFTSTQLENVARVTNRGLEISLRGVVIERPNLAWNVRGSYHGTRNNVASLGTGAPLSVAWSQWIEEGYPAGAFFDSRYVMKPGGQAQVMVDTMLVLPGQTEAQMVRLITRPAELELREREYIGPAFPTRNVTLGSDVRLRRNWTVNVLLDHKGGHYTSSSTSRWLTLWKVGPNDPNYMTVNGADTTYNPRFAPGMPVSHMCLQNAYIERDGEIVPTVADPIDRMRCENHFSHNRGNHIYPADNWRLRELSLAYRVPREWLGRMRVSSATVSLAGRNLARWQKYPWLEAEATYYTPGRFNQQTYFDTPLPREWVGSVSFTF